MRAISNRADRASIPLERSPASSEDGSEAASTGSKRGIATLEIFGAGSLFEIVIEPDEYTRRRKQ